MLAFTYFSIENIIILLIAAFLFYVHWALAVAVLLLDVFWVCYQSGKCSLKGNASLKKIQNVVCKEKRLFVWKRNKFLRKLLCRFEENCQKIHASLVLLDLPESSVVKNMNDVLRQLQGEFVDALYEFYVVGKNCKKTEEGCADDLKYVEGKITSIKGRLESLQKSVELAHLNTLRIHQLSDAMQGMTETLSPDRDS